jgi:hypothetical protein
MPWVQRNPTGGFQLQGARVLTHRAWAGG